MAGLHVGPDPPAVRRRRGRARPRGGGRPRGRRGASPDRRPSSAARASVGLGRHATASRAARPASTHPRRRPASSSPSERSVTAIAARASRSSGRSGARTASLVEQAHQRERGLRRHRVRAAAEVAEEERQPALVDPAGRRPSRRPGRRAQRDELARDLVGGHGHDAVAAHREDRQGPGVVAGEDRDVARPVAADPGDLLEVAAGLLDRDDPRMLGEPQERVRVDVRAGPARHVVDDDRQVALVGDGPVVGLEHPAVGPVVVRRDDERGVGPELGGAAGRADRGRRVVGAGAGDHADARPRRALARRPRRSRR